eukprot:tig00021525_g22123.t1
MLAARLGAAAPLRGASRALRSLSVSTPAAYSEPAPPPGTASGSNGASEADKAAAPKPRRKLAPYDPSIYPRPPPPPRKSLPHHTPPDLFRADVSKPDYFRFEILHRSTKSRARVGRIYTPHGVIDTPGFVGVGTNGSLKSLDVQMADQEGLQLMFCNTYHLVLQPGSETVAKAGGLHKFLNRKNPIITDSGGFQVFSLAYGSVEDELNMKARKKKKIVPTQEGPPGVVSVPDENESQVLKINEEGVKFRSYRDGRIIELSPEKSVAAQKNLGADIIIPFDELPPYHIDPEVLRESVHRTHRWETRSLAYHLNDRRQQAMYAVIHGGMDFKLRKESADYLTQLPFDGFAVGGALGKDRDELVQLLEYTMPLLPYDRPNHLLGIADDLSIGRCVPHGVDTFDSCYPTRAARHGTLFARNGRVQITRGKFGTVFEPIDKECKCHTCTNYTAAYVNHLFKANEPAAHILATIHNVRFMVDYMAQLRARIARDEI